MPSEPPAHSDRSEPLRVDQTVACERCGRFGALSVGERLLCPDCHAIAGSCCLEFASDDLWEFRHE